MPTSLSGRSDDEKKSLGWFASQAAQILALQLQVGEVYSMREAATFLGVSKQRVTQLAQSGRLRSWRLGRAGVIPLADLKIYKKLVESGDIEMGRGCKALPVHKIKSLT